MHHVEGVKRKSLWCKSAALRETDPAMRLVTQHLLLVDTISTFPPSSTRERTAPRTKTTPAQTSCHSVWARNPSQRGDSNIPEIPRYSIIQTAPAVEQTAPGGEPVCSAISDYSAGRGTLLGQVDRPHPSLISTRGAADRRTPDPRRGAPWSGDP